MADDHNDPLVGIDDVDWAALEHAYGPATDVPELLRELAAGGGDDGKNDIMDTYTELYGNIYHQGTRYPATVVAIPFLYRLLDDPRTPHKEHLLDFLVRLATGLASEDTEARVGEELAKWLAKEVRPVLQDAAAVVARQRQEREAYVAAAKTEKERQMREQRFYYLGTPEKNVEETKTHYRAYCAMQDGLASVVACLADPSVRVRAHAAFALAWFPATLATTRPALSALLAREAAAADGGDEAVRATALFSMAVAESIRRATTTTAVDDGLPEADPTIVQELQDAYADPRAGEFVRWAASLGLLKLGRANPEQRALVLHTRDHADDLAAYVASKSIDSRAFPFADGLGSSGIGELAGAEREVDEIGIIR